MTSIFDEQFQQLLERFPSATFETRADGSRRIRIPDYQLPKGGWNRESTAIYFVTMPSYPQAQPDCFWTDPGLTLANGGIPKNASVNNNHGGPEQLLWFSWHASKWNPNGDSLLTYVHVIDRRLRQVE